MKGKILTIGAVGLILLATIALFPAVRANGLPGDLDGDGDADIADLMIVVGAWNTCEGDPGFISEADFNEDGCINILDIMIFVSEYWGTSSVGADVEIKPETLNLRSKGMFTAFIMLPEGYNLTDIDISTVECEGAHAVKGMVADDNMYIAKFDREDLVGVTAGDEVLMTVEGELYDGTYFYGADTVRVKG